MNQVRVEINGEKRELAEDSLSVSDLIDRLSLAPQRIAIEVNRRIVSKSEWANTLIRDGDRIEIVHFVGGGSNR